MKRRICIYTSSRAEYGLLKNLLKEIKAEPNLQLQILASGMHLSAEFGMTIQEIRSDGFEPDEVIEILLSSDTPTAVCKSMGLAMISYGEALQRLKPDMTVVLGDRFETFCMAAAAQVCRIPLAHIHGGEITHGAMDEAFRHSITKMAYLHFASCKEYRQRIIQLGETPDRVFNVGALGVENIRRMSLMTRSEIAESIGFNLERPYFLVTFHPTTLEKSTSEDQFQSLLDALDAFPEYAVIFTKANADMGGRVINHMIDEYAAKQPEHCFVAASLGSLRYLSAMKHATALIGNSSSGIIEAPSLKVPAVNIGSRQNGRIQAASIVNCSTAAREIQKAIDHALVPAFRESLPGILNPYERSGTCSAIVRLLKKIDIDGITPKTFYDVRFS